MAQVPASVTVAAGATSVTFSVTTSAVANNSSVVISGTYGVTKSATLNVNAAVLSSLSLNPATLVGGNTSTGTVTLNGAAPSGGAVIGLQSSNTSVAQVPAGGTVTIAAGSTSATFTINTTPVATNTPVVISGVYGSVTKTATLNVNAAVLSSLN